MEFSLITSPSESNQTDCLILGIFENQKHSPESSGFNLQTQGFIDTIIQRDNFDGTLGNTLTINFIPNNLYQRCVLVGLGNPDQPLSSKNYRKLLTSTIKALKNTPSTNATCCLSEITVENQNNLWKVRQIVEVFQGACYQFSDLKSKPGCTVKLIHIGITAPEDNRLDSETGLKQGIALANAIEFTKNLADSPGNVCTPSYLAEKALQLSQQNNRLSTRILEEDEMAELGMGALLSVSRGSRQPAKLITLEYRGGNLESKPIVLVGKGLTFDAGGISLKPSSGMDEMKYDMCGGASVLGVFQALSDLNLPINVIGLIPTSENMPDGDANKPGDIVTSMSGQTIEILNTDAEGRLILCDTLTYAQKYNPEVVIDLATLTGACITALGRHPSGLLGNDDALCEDLFAAANTACDPVWRLPLWEEYQEQLKSNFADMANIGGPAGGTITAACFLSRFAEDFRWAHLDIAGTAWKSGDQKGATGRPVPLLTQYLIDFSNNASN
jgi:leucyl aminopeptidase